MTTKAMEIGMRIADKHEQAIADILKAKPDATIQECLKGAKVWLGAEIMKALHDFNTGETGNG